MFYLQKTPHFYTNTGFAKFLYFFNLPNSGTASDVAGIVSATILRNTVSDSKIVTPKNRSNRIEKQKEMKYYYY